MSENGYEEFNGSEAAEPSSEVYRRRRIVAALIALLAILLLIWGLTWVFGKIGGSNDDNASSAASTSESSEPFDSFSARPSESDSASADASESADPSDSASPSDEASASESADPSASASAEATDTPEATDSATPSESAETTQTPEPTPTEAQPLACGASNMNVVLSASQPSYGKGQNPSLALTYTNTSQNPCDIPADAQNVVINITSGSAQVYNTATCQVSPAAVAQLAPGQVGQTAFTWDRKLNSLGCNNLRDIQPGYYWATATVNGVTSEPARIVISG